MRGAVTPMGVPHLRLSELFTQFPSQYERPTGKGTGMLPIRTGGQYHLRRVVPYGINQRQLSLGTESKCPTAKVDSRSSRVEAATEGQRKYNCDHAAHPKFRSVPVAPAKWLRDAQRSLSQLRDTCSCVIPSERAVAKRVRGRNR